MTVGGIYGGILRGDPDDLFGAPQYNELIIVEHEYYVNVNRLFRPSKDYEHDPSLRLGIWRVGF